MYIYICIPLLFYPYTNHIAMKISIIYFIYLVSINLYIYHPLLAFFANSTALRTAAPPEALEISAAMAMGDYVFKYPKNWLVLVLNIYIYIYIIIYI